MPEVLPAYLARNTPIETHRLPGTPGHVVYVKRDDAFTIAGIRGGKVRACWHLAQALQQPPRRTGLLPPQAATAGPRGLITASARKSPQMQIVARLAAKLGVPCRLHTASGEYTEEMRDAEAHGGTLVQHHPGYNSVIMARAEQDANDSGWVYIPFGMEHKDAMYCTRKQVGSIALTMAFGKMRKPNRIVICLGSGMSAAGVMWGLRDLGLNMASIPMVGVRIGADPTRRLDEFAPRDWRGQLTIVKSKHTYTDAVPTKILPFTLDPHYEAKCEEYLEPGDLFWVVGIRAG